MSASTALRTSSHRRPEYDALVMAPSLERRRLQCYMALIVGDIVSLLAGFGIVGYLYTGFGGGAGALLNGQILLPVFLTIALYNGSYSIAVLRSAWHGIYRVVAALLISAVAVVFVAFLAKATTEFSRMSFSGGVACSGLLLIWTRMQMRSFITWRCGQSVLNELVIDDGGPEISIPDAIHVSAEQMGLVPNLDDPHSLDRIGLVLRNIDRVVVSCPRERRYAWALMLKGGNIEGEVLDDLVVELGAQGARVVDRHGLLRVSSGPLGLRARAIKRAFDLVFASLSLLVLSPLLLLVAIAIKLEDGGSVLFIQRRLGRGNRFFDMYKFRSMSEDQADGDGVISASRQDGRVTRVGQFIRRTSIDELPQLFNVLIGDMSMVGPRPHAIGSQAGDKLFWEVDLRYWQRHSLRPGLPEGLGPAVLPFLPGRAGPCGWRLYP